MLMPGLSPRASPFQSTRSAQTIPMSISRVRGRWDLLSVWRLVFIVDQGGPKHREQLPDLADRLSAVLAAKDVLVVRPFRNLDDDRAALIAGKYWR